MTQSSTSHVRKHWYDRTYKLLLIPPLLLFIFSIAYLGWFAHTHGDLFHKDVSITGGTTITVFDSLPVSEVSAALESQFPDIIVRGISDLRTGEQHGFFVESKASVEELRAALEDLLGYELTNENSSIEFTGAALSASFYRQLQTAVIIAFIAMAVVVFLIFRTPFRSLSIIVCGFADIVMTVAVINLIGMQLSLAGIVAILMLIGYAIDTDMLLTTRVLRGYGSINQRIWGAFKTGILMTVAAIVAVAVSLFFTRAYSETLEQMFTIILIGLGFDIMNTWLTNASLLKWYSEVKKL